MNTTDVWEIAKGQFKEGIFWTGYILLCGIPILGHWVAIGSFPLDWLIESLLAYSILFPIAIAFINSQVR